MNVWFLRCTYCGLSSYGTPSQTNLLPFYNLPPFYNLLPFYNLPPFYNPLHSPLFSVSSLKQNFNFIFILPYLILQLVYQSCNNRIEIDIANVRRYNNPWLNLWKARTKFLISHSHARARTHTHTHMYMTILNCNLPIARLEIKVGLKPAC